MPIDASLQDATAERLIGLMDLDENRDRFRHLFEQPIPLTMEFRAHLRTMWPEIMKTNAAIGLATYERVDLREPREVHGIHCD